MQHLYNIITLFLVCAAVILLRFFGTTKILRMFTGASLPVEAVVDLLTLFVTKRHRV